MLHRALTASILLAALLVTGCAGDQQQSATPPPAAQAPGTFDRTVLPIAQPEPRDLHRAGRAQRHAAAALRGQGARGRAERAARPGRRPRLRRHQHLRRHHHTPTFDRLAAGGVHYNNFHTTAVCSPTRAALKSGRNHHVNNMGVDHRDRHGVPRQHRPDPQRRRARGRDAAPQRLQHRRLRQVARARGLGGQHGRARSTAGRPTRASTSSTASSAARPTSGRRSSTTASTRSSCRTIRTTTS